MGGKKKSMSCLKQAVTVFQEQERIGCIQCIKEKELFKRCVLTRGRGVK